MLVLRSEGYFVEVHKRKEELGGYHTIRAYRQAA